MILLIILTLLLTPPLQAAPIYKWVDKDGVVNFTDDYSKVPPFYRDRIKVLDTYEKATAVPPAPAQEMTPQKGEDRRKDIYGREETWWREKVRPLKKRLNEATENYENLRKKFMEKTTEFSGKLGSRTQYKMNIRDLNRINAEMNKYESQMVEAREMLERLSREAEESKANPDWLK